MRQTCRQYNMDAVAIILSRYILYGKAIRGVLVNTADTLTIFTYDILDQIGIWNPLDTHAD